MSINNCGFMAKIHGINCHCSTKYCEGKTWNELGLRITNQKVTQKAFNGTSRETVKTFLFPYKGLGFVGSK
jgi:hypothetical protein